VSLAFGVSGVAQTYASFAFVCGSSAWALVPCWMPAALRTAEEGKLSPPPRHPRSAGGADIDLYVCAPVGGGLGLPARQWIGRRWWSISVRRNIPQVRWPCRYRMENALTQVGM
jgi:hypothetical protein